MPCYKRVFVAECHNRYIKSCGKAAYTRGMRWVSEGGREGGGMGEGGEGKERREGAERAIPMSREGVAVLSS